MSDAARSLFDQHVDHRIVLSQAHRKAQVLHLADVPACVSKSEPQGHHDPNQDTTRDAPRSTSRHTPRRHVAIQHTLVRDPRDPERQRLRSITIANHKHASV